MLLYVIHGSGLVWNDNAGFGVCSQINEAVKVGGWLCEECRLHGMPNDHVKSEGCLCASVVFKPALSRIYVLLLEVYKTWSPLTLECMTQKTYMNA